MNVPNIATISRLAPAGMPICNCIPLTPRGRKVYNLSHFPHIVTAEARWGWCADETGEGVITMDFDLEGSNSKPSQSFLEIGVSEKGTKRLRNLGSMRGV